MPISKKHKCIYVHIPKNGGVSVEHALNIFGDDEKEDREKVYGRIKSADLLKYRFYSPVLQHLRIIDIRKIISEKNFNEFFKFAFVRNPWDRMVSLYNFNIPFMQNEKRDSNRVPTFEDFLFNGLNPFLRLQQCHFISDNDGRIIIDFVGRFENIDKDFQQVCGNLGIATIRLPHKNRIGHRHYSTYYTEETMRFVAGLFKDDIEMFGYKFEGSSWLKENRQRSMYYIKNIPRIPISLFNKIKGVISS